MTRPRPRSLTRPRVLALAAVALVAGSLLTACVNTTHQTADWLKGRPGVLSVTESGAYSDQKYSGVDRVELDPKVSEKTITTLIADTVKQVKEHGDDRVAVQFGVDNVDFIVFDSVVTSRAKALTAFNLWQKLRTTKGFSSLGIGSATVTQSSVTVRTPRKPALDVYAALDKLPADIDVATYTDPADLDGNFGGAFVESVDVVASQLCSATPEVVDFAKSVLKDDSVAFGTLDLCAGFDITYAEGTLIGATAPPMRRQLDAAQLSQFPVTIAAPVAGSPDGSDFHRAVVSPGAAGALGVLPYLEAAGAPVFDFSLDADRNLAITSISTGSPSTQLLALLAAAPAAPGLPLITLDDGRTGASGTLGELGGLLTFADGLQTASKQIEDVELAAATGTITLTNTNDIVNVPDFTEGATALVASNLWQTRDLTISYQGVQAHIVNGSVQKFDKSKTNNFDDVLQAFLDAFQKAHG